MAARILAQRELNRALLARQLLLGRVRLPVPRTLSRHHGELAAVAGIEGEGLAAFHDGGE